MVNRYVDTTKMMYAGADVVVAKIDAIQSIASH